MDDRCDNCGKADLDCECVSCGSCCETVDGASYDHDLEMCRDCYNYDFTLEDMGL